MTHVISLDNWNGKLMMDCFPIIRPSSDNLIIGSQIQINIKSALVGYATVVSGIEMRWKQISDNVSYLYMGMPAPYVKKFLASQFGFTLNNPVTSESPIFFGFAKWTERHMPTQGEMFQQFFDLAKQTHTTIDEEDFIQSSFF